MSPGSRAPSWTRLWARAPRVLLGLGAVMVLSVPALLLSGWGRGYDGSAAAATSPASSSAAPSVSPSASTSPAPVGDRSGARSVPAPAGVVDPVAPALRPVRITIPAIGVDAKVTDLGIAGNGTIEVPRVPARAGWLETSPAPGQRGPAVIAGHVDSTTGPAVFYRLRELRPGDAIVVTRGDGTKVRFAVDGLGAYPKNRFPTQATYGPVPGPALRLITCGGSYVKSRGGYLDNVVVFAT